MPNSSTASGEAWAALASRKSRVPSPIRSRPGMNFRTSGFGVASVWMNMGKMWRVRGPRARLGQLGDLFVGEVAGDEGDRDLAGAPLDAFLGERGDEGAGAAPADSGGQHQDLDVRV